MKKVNYFKFRLKNSNSEPIVNKIQLPAPGRTEQEYGDSVSVEINLFIFMVKVKCMLLHYTEFRPEKMIGSWKI